MARGTMSAWRLPFDPTPTKNIGSCHLRVGNRRFIAGRLPLARTDSYPLLAQHSLELALKGNRKTAKRRLLVPTGSGKTALSNRARWNSFGEKSSTAIQWRCTRVRHRNVKAQRSGAGESSHHCFSWLIPRRSDRGDYARQARQVLAEINARGHLPIVVGGTGLYLRALLEGLFAGPQGASRNNCTSGCGNVLPTGARICRPSSFCSGSILRARNIHSKSFAKLIRAIEVSCASRHKL